MKIRSLCISSFLFFFLFFFLLFHGLFLLRFQTTLPLSYSCILLLPFHFLFPTTVCPFLSCSFTFSYIYSFLLWSGHFHRLIGDSTGERTFKSNASVLTSSSASSLTVTESDTASGKDGKDGINNSNSNSSSGSSTGNGYRNNGGRGVGGIGGDYGSAGQAAYSSSNNTSDAGLDGLSGR